MNGSRRHKVELRGVAGLGVEGGSCCIMQGAVEEANEPITQFHAAHKCHLQVEFQSAAGSGVHTSRKHDLETTLRALGKNPTHM